MEIKRREGARPIGLSERGCGEVEEERGGTR